MAINIKNYVDITTTLPNADVAGRSFGGLVFTAMDMLPQEEGSELKEAYDTFEAGGVCYLNLDEVGILFGTLKDSPKATSIGVDKEEDDPLAKYTDEYGFALGYYDYISPSGRFASRLAFSKVMDKESPLDAFNRVNAITNQFGSFVFLSLAGSGDASSDSGSGTESDTGADKDIQALKEMAEEVAKLDTKYLVVVNRTRGSLSPGVVAKECSDNFANIKGVVYVSGASDKSGYMPMAILGSTDYTNGQVVNFMFKQFNTETPTVFDDDTYKTLNSAYVNFYGRTQTNGQTLDFYQRGYNTNGTDTAVYCNEMWFKAICETALTNLLMSRESLPASALGIDLVKLEIIDCCASASRNAMFMPKEPIAQDVRAIREIVTSTGGDETDVGAIEADVSTKGYSVYAVLFSREDNLGAKPTSEKTITYYVFYGTADSVRYIKGNDLLLK